MAGAETGDQNARAVEVLQRLLTDPEFRRLFRHDPSGACRAAGLDEAAAEFAGSDSALQTLELRESKSSLAGLLMAAAAEGAAVYQFAEHAHSNFGGELADLARQALDRSGGGGGGAAHEHAAEHVLAQAPAPAAPPALGGAAPGVMADAAAAIEHAHGDPGEHVVHIAKKFVGVPYVWGGESPSGFDCSGLVQYCYKQIGVHLERTTWDQVKEGHAVGWGHFKPGDLIFSNFEGPGAGATHVVIYAGHGQVIAAPHTGGHVEYESVDVFKPYFMGARRVVPDTPPNMGIPAVSPSASAADVAQPAPAASASGTLGMSTVPASPAGATPAPAPNAAGVHSTLGSIQLPPALQHHGGGMLDGIIGAYPGDHASQTQIASWMGDAAQRAGLPRELPVMAALVESGLKNDHYGDRDSLGFFQMRTSIWDHGKYAGFSNDPRKQLRWFIDEATALKAERLREGIHNFGSDPHTWGNWIADIERPAAQYRYRYQLQLENARRLVGG